MRGHNREDFVQSYETDDPACKICGKDGIWVDNGFDHEFGTTHDFCAEIDCDCEDEDLDAFEWKTLLRITEHNAFEKAVHFTRNGIKQLDISRDDQEEWATLRLVLNRGSKVDTEDDVRHFMVELMGYYFLCIEWGGDREWDENIRNLLEAVPEIDLKKSVDKGNGEVIYTSNSIYVKGVR